MRVFAFKHLGVLLFISIALLYFTESVNFIAFQSGFNIPSNTDDERGGSFQQEQSSTHLPGEEI